MLLGLVSYIIALLGVYHVWEPEGFFGFIGALFISGFLAVPVTFVIAMVLTMVGVNRKQ